MCRLFSVAAIVASVVLLGACGSAVPQGESDVGYSSVQGGQVGSTPVASSSSVIGEDEAVDAALRRAGVSGSDVSSLFVSHEVDDGRSVFHVEFVVGYDEYDVDVDASTGSIVDYDVDSLRD